MKRVLIIAYYFPPQPKAGALRVGYLAHNLRQFGWQPTVITNYYPNAAQFPFDVAPVKAIGWHEASNDHRLALAVKKRPRHPASQLVRNVAKSVVHFPDEAVGWFPPAAVEGVVLTSRRRFDAVLTSAPPWNSLLVGRTIASLRRLPWVVDYRDVWAGPPGPYFRHSGRVRLAVEYAVEKRVLRAAAAVTTPTQGMAEAIAAHHDRPDVQVIPNACDFAAWESIAVEPPSEFRICYTGKLYVGLRTPDAVFAAVAKLRDAGDAAGLAGRFDFYGEDPEMVVEAAARYGLTNVVNIHGVVDRKVAMQAQRSSAVLLLLLNTTGAIDPIEQANPGSKVLEYAGARRPILAVGAPGNKMQSFMDESGLGLFVSDEGSCMQALRELYARFTAGKLEPSLRPSWEPFKPTDLARAFASTFDRAVAKHRQTYIAEEKPA